MDNSGPAFPRHFESDHWLFHSVLMKYPVWGSHTRAMVHDTCGGPVEGGYGGMWGCKACDCITLHVHEKAERRIFT